MTTILRREVFSDTTFLWEVLAPEVASAARPGQFVILRLREGAERIPLTIADYDPIKGTITMVVQALGKTTREMMAHYQQGDAFKDFVGPLGLPQHVEKIGHVVLVGGGLGVAPIYPQLRAFKQAGNRTTGIVGFRTRGLVFWEDRFREQCDDFILCTDDGSYGRAGLVTAALEEVCRKKRPDLVVAIGPLPMMRACAEATRPHGVKTLVSLNAVMVDGTGMCGSCRVTVGGTVRFACVDGPEFDGHQVDFAELATRQRRFKEQESAASDSYLHVCNLERQLFDQGKRNYKKFGGLAPTQTHMPERNPAERSRDFKEVNLGYSLAEALSEAERCIQCAKPTCVSGCPVSIDIPRFIRHLLIRDLDGALESLNESNVFPSVCGRVCPQETQCEAQCILARKMEPVAIGRLERFVGDHGVSRKAKPLAFRQGDRLGKVAVCGSGPASLSCAADLARYGAEVVIYEALHVIGGVLRYGIPSFRLPREIIDREVQHLVEVGVRFETNRVIGKTFTVPQLLGPMGFDAVFLGVGSGAPAFLGIKGENAGLVYSANEFLTRVNLMGGDRFPLSDTPVRIGRSIVVIGAGNTAMDCLRVGKRLGAPTVRCVYRRSEAEAPARVEEIRHAKEEGIEFMFLHSPLEILADANGDVRGMKIEKMALGEPDKSGRRRPIPTGEVFEIPCDTVISALGTKANPIVARSTPGLQVNEWGNIVSDDVTQTTSVPGVFAGGDIVTGAATVILAMGAGRRAARCIAAYLQAGKSKWPVTEEVLEAFRPPSPIGQGSARAGMPSPPAAEVNHTCPRCHRPLEEHEEYICCAASSLAWRCAECAKVSEGFAFPYGLCPACGGKLAPLPERMLADTALEAVRSAFEIELGGLAFYKHALHQASDPLMRKLFEKLAQMESEHMVTLSRRYHIEAPEAPAAFPLERAALSAGLENHPQDPDNLFRVAIGLEERAARFFDEAGATFSADSAERELCLELAAEEREHVAILTTEFAQYRRGRPGML
ncbi:MAG TPA: NADPH-dependent glutamate synthase [Anaeromyxobacteraceae bacterium]|nr:NADPH-dependent glutamate synthase [Anaeromyxobacteraceae bacterium]